MTLTKLPHPVRNYLTLLVRGLITLLVCTGPAARSFSLQANFLAACINQGPLSFCSFQSHGLLEDQTNDLKRWLVWLYILRYIYEIEQRF
ncbi:hypothetical protein CROQUDRAFT_98562 [Cronartium quercuum f. sp. fusiforme G11]|uniref:Uncharacterized protein n=1 Tax=Cronartium quercuum f. sp. fusiforme G11 TaxID=708437 RepID=A0A9P6T738_9BASI|nr:hypothetical protein CROQUDRAFT_98562 [Cronartium quercuum f. sp. fusiforme G11]